MHKYDIWITEILWWIGSALIAVFLIWPYYLELIVDVPFLIPNIILIVLMVQCLRLTFFLRQSPFSGSRWLIYLLTFTFIPLSMYSIKQYSVMAQFFNDSNWIHSFSYLIPLSGKSDLAGYIRTEFMWVTVVAFISGFVFSGRMVLASWRIINKKPKI